MERASSPGQNYAAQRLQPQLVGIDKAKLYTSHHNGYGMLFTHSNNSDISVTSTQQDLTF